MNSRVITQYFQDDFDEVVVAVDLYNNEWFCGTQLVSILEIGIHKSILKIVNKNNRKKLKNLELAVDIDTFMEHDAVRAKWCGIETIFVNFAGVFELIHNSKIRKAIDFRNWLTTTVLVELSTNGYYSITDNRDKIDENDDISVDVEANGLDDKTHHTIQQNIKHRLIELEQETRDTIKVIKTHYNKQVDIVKNNYEKRILKYKNREAQMQITIRKLSSKLDDNLGKIVNQINNGGDINKKRRICLPRREDDRIIYENCHIIQINNNTSPKQITDIILAVNEKE
nr:BRO-C [Trichoplusia ni single nucleopolyhedrovirus]